MKIKDNSYIIHQVDKENLAIPVGEESDRTNGIMKLTEAGLFLWQQLQHETGINDLIKALTDEYDVDEATAEADVKEFVGKLAGFGCLE